MNSQTKLRETKKAKGIAWRNGSLIVFLPYSVIEVKKDMVNALFNEREECICNDYDEKGVSTCGFPCPVHSPKVKQSSIDQMNSQPRTKENKIKKLKIIGTSLSAEGLYQIAEKINEIIERLNDKN